MGWVPTGGGSHAASHADGGADELDAADLASGAASDGDVLTADGAGGAAWETPASGNLPTPSAKGDIAVYDGSDWVIVGVGSDDQVLTADAAQSAGVKWAAGGGGGGGVGTDSAWATRIDRLEPAAYWKLDETSGTTAVDSKGDLDADIVGTPTLDATGINPDGDGCIHFDGSDDRVDMDSFPNYNSTQGKSCATTVAMWVNADTLSGKQTLFEAGGTGSTFAIEFDGTTLYALGAGGGDFSVSAAGLSAGTTYFIVAVWDRPLARIALYVDGVLQAQGSDPSNYFAGWGGGDEAGIGGTNSDAKHHDGSTTTGGGDYFDGRISSVAFFTRALTEWEIEYLYDGSLPFGT